MRSGAARVLFITDVSVPLVRPPRRHQSGGEQSTHGGLAVPRPPARPPVAAIDYTHTTVTVTLQYVMCVCVLLSKLHIAFCRFAAIGASFPARSEGVPGPRVRGAAR